jgi:UDP-N-acetylmuramoyl-tripeptide--D-alanyl-D-alanine ligase
MNHPGEIAGLAAMSAPRVALVNNAQREHQEFMATVKAVAEENGAVIASLPSDGTAVFPADDAYTPLWRELAGARRTMTFALARDTSAADAVKADVLGRSQWQGQGWQVQATTPAGPLSFVLHMAGRHNVKNALGAAAAAVAAGAPMQAIESGLNAFRAVKGRSSLMACHLAGGAAASVSLVDDTYNANPDSVRAAIDVLSELPAPRWLILGDMGEVGDQGVAFHTEVGAYAREQGLEHLWCAGTLCEAAAQAFGPKARWFADTMTLVQALSQDSLNKPSVKSVLVKGSRFMAMERVVQALTSQGRQHAA